MHRFTLLLCVLSVIAVVSCSKGYHADYGNDEIIIALMNQYNDDCLEIVKNKNTTSEQAIKLHTYYTTWGQRAGRSFLRACPRDEKKLVMVVTAKHDGKTADPAAARQGLGSRDEIDYFYNNGMSGGQKPREIIQESKKKYPAAGGFTLTFYPDADKNKSKSVSDSIELKEWSRRPSWQCTTGVVVAAPIETVIAVLTDLQAYPRWHKGMTECQDIKKITIDPESTSYFTDFPYAARSRYDLPGPFAMRELWIGVKRRDHFRSGDITLEFSAIDPWRPKKGADGSVRITGYEETITLYYMGRNMTAIEYSMRMFNPEGPGRYEDRFRFFFKRLFLRSYARQIMEVILTMAGEEQYQAAAKDRSLSQQFDIVLKRRAQLEALLAPLAQEMQRVMLDGGFSCPISRQIQAAEAEYDRQYGGDN